ncbi:GntR family transcriptional regulator [Ottowia sp.]|uniref:GntR family transcriptional regulator n=1 Tax=Ottowia sp. TaxID=1898956 RepID=UPI003C7907E2
MRLAEHLLQQIKDGTYQPGDLLPSEAALCQQFEISRITARGALKELEIRGMVSRRPGVGTQVLAAQAQAPVFAHAGGSVDDVLQFTRGVPFKLQSIEEITVSRELSLSLDLPEGQRFARLHALRQMPDGQRLVAGDHYVPALLLPPRATLDSLDSSLAQCVADFNGDSILTIRQQIGACLLSGEDARELDLEPRSAAVCSRRWYAGRGDRLLLLSVSLFPADRYTFNSVLVRHEGHSP